MFLADVDMSNLATSEMSRSATSCPSRLQTARSNAQGQTVARRSRISFEVHPSLLEEDDVIGDSDVDSDDDNDEDPLDLLMMNRLNA